MAEEIAPKNDRPETFRDKLWLLIIDKVAIGTLVAVAFFGYDQWKTDETREYNNGQTALAEKKEKTRAAEIQAHSDSQTEVDRDFKRAEYVEKLIPIVIGEQDITYRAHALAALIETGSIGADSAIAFADQLVEAGVLGRMGYAEDVYDLGDEVVIERHDDYGVEGYFFLKAIEKTMPDGLSALMRVLAQREAELWPLYFPPARDDPANADRKKKLEESVSFWARVFRKAVRNLSDDKLLVLKSPYWLNENVDAVSQLVRSRIPIVEARQWQKSNLNALRIVGSLSILSATAVDDADSVLILAGVLGNHGPGHREIQTAAAVFRLLNRLSITRRQFTEIAQSIALQGTDGGDSKVISVFAKSRYEDRYDAAWGYLNGIRVAKGDYQSFESRALDIIQKYLRRIVESPVDQISTGRRHPGEQWLVIMVTERYTSPVYGEIPSAETRRLLSEFYALPPDKIEKLDLTNFAEQWKLYLVAHPELR